MGRYNPTIPSVLNILVHESIQARPSWKHWTAVSFYSGIPQECSSTISLHEIRTKNTLFKSLSIHYIHQIYKRLNYWNIEYQRKPSYNTLYNTYLNHSSIRFCYLMNIFYPSFFFSWGRGLNQIHYKLNIRKVLFVVQEYFLCDNDDEICSTKLWILTQLTVSCLNWLLWWWCWFIEFENIHNFY